MQVTAVATLGQSDWRWRIVNNAGEIVEEPREGFPDMAVAISEGKKRLEGMNSVDRSKRPFITTRGYRNAARRDTTSWRP
jgi:hypothetical protein